MGKWFVPPGLSPSPIRKVELTPEQRVEREAQFQAMFDRLLTQELVRELRSCLGTTDHPTRVRARNRRRLRLLDQRLPVVLSLVREVRCLQSEGAGPASWISQRAEAHRLARPLAATVRRAWAAAHAGCALSGAWLRRHESEMQEVLRFQSAG